MSNVEQLKTETILAAELRADIAAALVPVCAIMDRAKTSGLTIQFNLGTDLYNRTRVDNLTILKPL